MHRIGAGSGLPITTAISSGLARKCNPIEGRVKSRAPAKDSHKRATDPRYQAFCSVICPRTSVKVVRGHGTSVIHMLTMAFDDPTMADDLRTALAVHEIVLGDEWADVEWPWCQSWQARGRIRFSLAGSRELLAELDFSEADCAILLRSNYTG